jgi:hypothetical protein
MAPDPSSHTADPFLTGRQWLLVGMACVAFTALAFLTPPSILGSLDFVRMHEPYKIYAARALHEGRLPLWNPHTSLGRPFLADIETAVFYPPSLLFVVLGAEAGWVLLAALHLFLLVAGTARLARDLGAHRPQALAAGFSFAAGATVFLCFHSGQVQYSMGLCWMPLVLLLARRLQDAPSARGVALLALATAMQVLAGHPQIAWVTAVGQTVWLLGRRLQRPVLAAARATLADLARLAAALALGVMGAAVELLPFAELVGQGNRHRPSLEFAGHYAMPVQDWGSLLIQLDGGRLPLTVHYLYGGVVVLLAGLAWLTRTRERESRAMLLLAVIAGLVAAGNSTPIFALFYYVLPGLSVLRIPARMTVLIALVLVLAAAVWTSQVRFERKDKLALLLFALVALATSLLALLHSGSAAPSEIAWHVWQVALVLGGTGVLWARQALGHRSRALLGLVLVALTAADLGLSARTMKRHYRVPHAQLATETEVARRLRAAGLLAPGRPPARVVLPQLRQNAAMIYGWSTFDAYGSLALDRVWTYVHVAAGLPVPALDNTFVDPAVYRLGPFPFKTMNLVLGHDPARGSTVVNPSPDPRAYVVSRARVVPDWRQVLSQMVAGHDTDAEALVEPGLAADAARLSQQSTGGRATIVEFAPERLRVEVSTAAPGLLIVKEAWYPGWNATVNGQPAPCQPANVWMRAIPVPAGRSEVVLQYHSRFLLLGAILSVIALAVLARMLRRRRKRHEGPCR